MEIGGVAICVGAGVAVGVGATVGAGIRVGCVPSSAAGAGLSQARPITAAIAKTQIKTETFKVLFEAVSIAAAAPNPGGCNSNYAGWMRTGLKSHLGCA